MYITLRHLNKTYTLNINPYESLMNQISNSLKINSLLFYASNCGKPINEFNIKENMLIDIIYKIKGGRALNENDKELVKLRNDIKVCYKCNGRLKLTMTHCRKKKCGKDSKLRLNKKRRQVGKK